HNTVSRLLDLSANVGYVSSLLALPQNDNNDQGILPSGLLGLPASFFTDTTNGGYLFLTPQQANFIATTQRVERFTGGVTENLRTASLLTMRGTGGYDPTNQGDNEHTHTKPNPL